MYLILLLWTGWFAGVTGQTEYPMDVPRHAIYISVVKINHKPGTTEATLNMRVFQDDLKNVLRHEYGYESISEKPTFCADYAPYIQLYFSEQLRLQVNNTPVSLTYASGEAVEDVYQLSFRLDCPDRWRTLHIEAPYFSELFPDQSNIFHVESLPKKGFGRITRGQEALRMVF